jgi:nucleoside-diphosphate-sugar epimerase
MVFGAIPYRKREVMFAQADIKEAAKKLGWKPKFSLHEGIERTLKMDKIIK